MFNFLRKKRKQKVSEVIYASELQGVTYLSIDLWIKDQILFQVLPARKLEKYGITTEAPKDYAIFHFFNKNKTRTIQAWEFFKENYESLGLTFTEDPVDYHFFARNIGPSPEEVEHQIEEGIKLYPNIDRDQIRIEYKSY